MKNGVSYAKDLLFSPQHQQFLSGTESDSMDDSPRTPALNWLFLRQRHEAATMMKVREYTEADVGAVAALFTASVHELGSSHYNAEQREAWAPRPPDLGTWASRLAKLQTLLVHVEEELAGFIAYEINGHIDLLYTAPRFKRCGVASLLYRQVECALRETDLFTEASLVARPFFLRHGFQVTEEQRVIRRGVTFRRFAMRKLAVAQNAQPDRSSPGIGPMAGAFASHDETTNERRDSASESSDE